MPLEVVPPPMVDDVIGVPLIVCPKCKDLRLVAATCKWTANRGRRFFKCPRNNDWVSGSVNFIMKCDNFVHRQFTCAFLYR